MSDTKLLPCPFCGVEAELRKCEPGYDVVCKSKYCTACSPTYLNKNGAISFWNTRRPMEQIVEQLEEYPHGKYKDDYGKGFSNGINAAIEIVQKVGAE